MSEVPKKKGDLQKMSQAELKALCELHNVVYKSSGKKGAVKVDYVDALYTYANAGGRPPVVRDEASKLVAPQSGQCCTN